MLRLDVIPQLGLFREGLCAVGDGARVILNFLMNDTDVCVVRAALRKRLPTLADVCLFLSHVLHPLVSSQRHFRDRLESALVAVEPLALALVQVLFHLN